MRGMPTRKGIDTHVRAGRLSVRFLAIMLSLLFAGLAATASHAQSNHIAARLVAEGPAEPGGQTMLAIAFDPDPGWHGYWANPGDAGYGMTLDWQLPQEWRAGEPLYPVPQRLEIAGLMNHVYEGPYAVMVPISVPEGAPPASPVRIAVDAQWLACTDEICVPERAQLHVTLPQGRVRGELDQFAHWRAAVAPMLDRFASFELAEGNLRVAIPLPASLEIGGGTHLFVENTDLVDYAAAQAFSRQDNLLIAEIPLKSFAERPEQVSGILALGEDNGVRFEAEPGDVPSGGKPIIVGQDQAEAPYWLLILGALAGGLLLNVLPCVFPILSLKALSLARAGRSEAAARREGLWYTAGVVLACLVLGAIILLLRAGGEQIGWAFQLQEPGVVVALLVLAAAITANLAGLYRIPQFAFSRSGKPLSSFATGLLAAVVATPCTGPFMAAALGAALLLPPVQALVLFGALGIGLALPFLLLGFVPALRNKLPKPGPWMEHFRRLMAIPMGLTALALAWLCWRLGGAEFTIYAIGLASAVLAALGMAFGERKASRKFANPAALSMIMVAGIFTVQLSDSYSPQAARGDESLLDPLPFSEQVLAETRASGRPVFLWFTADWCLTCKVNESVSIEREATRDAFEEAGVVAIRGDWTRRDPEITAYLTRHGAAGVPLYVWYDPGGEAEILPQVLTPDMLIRAAGARPYPAPPARTAAR